MEDELSQLDELIESDVLDALGEKSLEQEEDINSVEIEDFVIEDLIEENPETEDEELLEKEWESEIDDQKDIDTSIKTVNDIDMSSTNLASLLSELLNNKTIEITIKIKD